MFVTVNIYYRGVAVGTRYMRDWFFLCIDLSVGSNLKKTIIRTQDTDTQRLNSNGISLRLSNMQYKHCNDRNNIIRSGRSDDILGLVRIHLNSKHLIIIRYGDGSPELCVACANGCRSLGPQVMCPEFSGCRGGPLGEAGVGGTRGRIWVT